MTRPAGAQSADGSDQTTPGPTVSIDGIEIIDRYCSNDGSRGPVPIEVVRANVTITAAADGGLQRASVVPYLNQAPEFDWPANLAWEPTEGSYTVALQGNNATVDVMVEFAAEYEQHSPVVYSMIVDVLDQAGAVGLIPGVGSERTDNLEVSKTGVCDGAQPTATAATPGPDATAEPAEASQATATPVPPATNTTPEPPKESLAFTGSSTTELTAFGVGLLLLGIGLVYAVRRPEDS